MEIIFIALPWKLFFLVFYIAGVSGRHYCTYYFFSLGLFVLLDLVIP